ncbi:MAG: class I SAM-dependent methyltransferase [Promethearchaeia archaeon]
MTQKNKTPIFPFSYIGEKAKEYDRQKWMERNQKNAAIRCLEYLFDDKLGKSDIELGDMPLILDLGCGTGFSCEIFLENSFKVVGIDILTDMITIASKKRKSYDYKYFELILGDITALPFRVDCFDHIISVSSYNFITHNAKCIREIRKILNNTAKYLRKILKKNGRIIIEFYPKNDSELLLFTKSFTEHGFNGYMVKRDPKQKGGQTFLLLKKEG